MVLGLDNAKSEKLWDILKIEQLEENIQIQEYANANHSAKIENLESASANHSAVLNQHKEKIQILESYHGKLNLV